MANYPLIFGVSLVINVVVTFRSSDKFKLYCGSSPRNQEDPHNKRDNADDGEEGDAVTRKDDEQGRGTEEADPLIDPLLKKGAGALDTKLSDRARHSALLRRYLMVYLLAALSDWLQGPYV